MPVRPKLPLSKALTEHITSTFPHYRLKKLFQKFGNGWKHAKC